MSDRPHVVARKALATELIALTREAWTNWKRSSDYDREASLTSFLRDEVGNSAHVTYSKVATAAKHPDEKRITTLESLRLFCERAIRPWLTDTARYNAFLEKVAKDYWPVEQAWLDKKKRNAELQEVFEGLAESRQLRGAVIDDSGRRGWCRDQIFSAVYQNKPQLAVARGLAIAHGLTGYRKEYYGSQNSEVPLAILEAYFVSGVVALEHGDEAGFARAKQGMKEFIRSDVDSGGRGAPFEKLLRNVGKTYKLAAERVSKLKITKNGTVDKALRVPQRMMTSADGSVAFCVPGILPLGPELYYPYAWREVSGVLVEPPYDSMTADGFLLNCARRALRTIIIARAQMGSPDQLDRAASHLYDVMEMLLGNSVFSASVWMDWYVAASELMKCAGNQYGMVMALRCASQISASMGNAVLTAGLEASTFNARLMPVHGRNVSELIEELIMFLEQIPTPIGEHGIQSHQGSNLIHNTGHGCGVQHGT